MDLGMGFSKFETFHKPKAARHDEKPFPQSAVSKPRAAQLPATIYNGVLLGTLLWVLGLFALAGLAS